MAARFVEAEFAADLSTVARGEGAETYRDPREFFRITFMTGGLRKVLRSAIERLAGKGGDPVIGLQTSFGGGKTHTMLALYHLAIAKNPETLPGLAEIFKEAGVTTLPIRSKPVVFVGTAAGANQPIAIEGARTVKSLWGLIAVRLGGWKAYETIKASDEERTNPGSEAMIAILKQASPCLILVDEVVAYARNLEGMPYDGFVSFFQSLTEAAKAVPGVLVVGSLPDSGAEVGDQRGRARLAGAGEGVRPRAIGLGAGARHRDVRDHPPPPVPGTGRGRREGARAGRQSVHELLQEQRRRVPVRGARYGATKRS